MVPARLLDTPTLQHLFRQSPGGPAPDPGRCWWSCRESFDLQHAEQARGSAQIACCMLPPALRHADGPPGGQHECRAGTTEGAAAPRRGCRARSWCGVVGAQHPQPVGQGLLVQRYGPAQVLRRRADRSAERSASDAWPRC